LNLLKKLKSINDRADDADSRAGASSHDFDLLVIAALREAECADLIEKTMEADLTSLCNELKRKEEALLQAREMTLVRSDEASKAQLAELESRIQNQNNQLRNLKTEQQKLTAERDRLVYDLSAAQGAAKEAEADAQQFKQRMEKDFSVLRQELAKREESTEATNPDEAGAEGDQRKEIETLQLRLQDADAKLASQEKELKEKERAIHAAGIRETELGKLIERLSAECEKLSAELCDKKLMVSRPEDKTRSSLIHGSKAWGKVVRLVRAGRNPSDK
jgi:chromosome segregation ATPase